MRLKLEMERLNMKKIVIVVIIVILVIGLFLIYNIYNKQDSNNGDIEKQEVQDNKVIQKEEGDNVMEINKMNIKIDGMDMSVTLENNETVKALLNKLPLEFVANELNGNEKYYYLDEDLPSNSQSVHRIEKGDIMLFGTDCLVIFYESFDTPYSYTRIGKIDDSSLLDNISSGSSSVSISK